MKRSGPEFLTYSRIMSSDETYTDIEELKRHTGVVALEWDGAKLAITTGKTVRFSSIGLSGFVTPEKARVILSPDHCFGMISMLEWAVKGYKDPAEVRRINQEIATERAFAERLHGAAFADVTEGHLY